MVIAMVPSGVVDLDEDGRAGVVAIRRVALTCSMNRGDSVVQFRLFFSARRFYVFCVSLT